MWERNQLFGLDIRYNFDIEIDIKDHKKLPKQEGVYLLYDWDNTLLYVGKARSLYDRMFTHIGTKQDNIFDYKFLFKSIKAVYTKDPCESQICETYLINKLKPKLNRYKVYYENDVSMEEYLVKSDMLKEEWKFHMGKVSKKQQKVNQIKSFEEKTYEIAKQVKDILLLNNISKITPRKIILNNSERFFRGWFQNNFKISQRKNIINNIFKELGVGIYINKNNGYKHFYLIKR